MILDLTDATVHVLLVAFSFLVLLISTMAFLERRERRYMFLSMAFAFLAASQVVELVETFFLNSQLVFIPYTAIHLSHFLDFLMLSSFSVALLARTSKGLGGTGN